LNEIESKDERISFNEMFANTENEYSYVDFYQASTYVSPIFINS